MRSGLRRAGLGESFGRACAGVDAGLGAVGLGTIGTPSRPLTVFCGIGFNSPCNDNSLRESRFPKIVGWEAVGKRRDFIPH
jgi:hypothetical protein